MDEPKKDGKNLAAEYLRNTPRKLEVERELYDLYIERFFKAAYRVLEGYPYAVDTTGHAEHAAQQAVVELLKSIRKFDFDKNFDVWAFSICKRTTLKYVRDNDLDAKRSPLEDVDKDPDRQEPDVADDFEDSDTVSWALSQLPESQRLIVEQRIYDSLPWEEIAQSTNSNPEQARSAFRRAIKALRAVLGKEKEGVR